jgi:hypothetical protein
MHHQKRERILMLLVLIGSVSFLVCCCGALEQQENSTIVEPLNITPLSQSGQYTTTLPAFNQKTFVYLPKTDYKSGEPIEISGSTTLPAGTHLYISVYTMGWHSKTKPEGQTTYLSNEVIVQNPSDGTDRNFFVSFDSTVLIPGDYYIRVDNLDAGPDEDAMLNQTLFPFTIDKSLISTQSGIPLAVTALMIMIAILFVSIWKKGNILPDGVSHQIIKNEKE